MQTPELSVLQAYMELKGFAERVAVMHTRAGQMIDIKEQNDFAKEFETLLEEEDWADQYETGIAHYLEEVSNNHLSEETKDKVRRMLRVISELESIADACYNLGRTLSRKQESGAVDFTPEQYENMHKMFGLTSQAMQQMVKVLREKPSENDTHETYRLENEINALRDSLKQQNLEDVNQKIYSYALGTMYTDFINECEHLGDYIVNVVQAHLNERGI